MRKVLLFAIFANLAIGLSAQQNLEDNEAIKNVFADAEFFFASDDYVDALLEYQRLFKRGFKDNANINYKIGICYLNIAGEKNKAIEYLLNAIPYASKNYRESSLREKNAPFDTYLYLGNAYRVTDQLDSAINVYNKYIELTKNEENLKLNHAFAKKQIENCKNAKTFMSNPLDLQVTNLGRPVNNNAANFRAVVSGDKSSMVYMNSLPFYDALYYSTLKDDGSWSTPTNITPQVQSDGDQYATDISYDGKILLLSREDAFDSDIFISYFEDGQWTKSTSIGSEINTKFWESHASLSKDGNTLYFASNRQGNKGEMDIYMSVKEKEGQWGPPILLSSNINTELNEDTPFITSDGTRLYFSSQGHTNIGGYDIFYVEKMDDGNWSKPVNVGYPINTTDDDLFYVPITNTLGYMAKLEDDGFGREDIYKYSVLGEETVAYQEKEEEIIPEETSDLVKEQQEIEPVDKIQEAQPQVEQLVEPTKEAIEEKAEVTKEEVPTIEEKVTKEVVAQTTVKKEEVKTEEPSAKVAVIEEIPEEKIDVEVTPILFDFDKFSLTDEAKQKLNGIVKLLSDERSITLELIGFTDSKGSIDYNLSLSKKRANEVAKYISSKGISTNRLTVTAKGATAFIAINNAPDGSDSPEGRKYNRRVEILFNNEPENIQINEQNIVPDRLKLK